MPERSPEIEQVIRDTLDAVMRSDIEEISRLTSRDPCVVSIGSDASEWAEGHEEIMRLFRASGPEGDPVVLVALGHSPGKRRSS